jgi:cupin 2 domain-containing protein
MAGEGTNIYESLPEVLEEESFELLQETDSFRVERIVSMGHTTKEGSWYDQPDDEWVLLLTGGAAILIEGEAAPMVMAPGDYIFLPAHCRHRVTWTKMGEKTVWLAVHARG